MMKMVLPGGWLIIVRKENRELGSENKQSDLL
jgi:hypothetical protein